MLNLYDFKGHLFLLLIYCYHVIYVLMQLIYISARFFILHVSGLDLYEVNFNKQLYLGAFFI